MRATTWMIALIPLLALGFTTPSGPGAADPGGGCVRGEPEYIGVDGCKKCHFVQWMSWRKTTMAKAFATLKPGEAADAKKKHGLDPEKDYTQDASCLPCHTTGYGKPGGYPALEPGKEWTDEDKKRAKEREGVQCESCHGPGSLTAPYKKDHEDYKKAKLLEMGLVDPDADNCKGCHNTDSPTVGDDYTFDYDELITDDSKIHKHKKLKHDH